MAAVRGKDRFQAAKRNDEDRNEKRWADAIKIPLCKGRHDSLPNPSLEQASTPSQTNQTSVLELSGLESPARTIFARIRPDETNEKGNENVNSATHRCWRVEDLVGRILNEISVHKVETNQGSLDENKTSCTLPPQVESSSSLLRLGAVWVLDPASVDRPQNKPVWKRLVLEPNAAPESAQSGEMSSILWFDDRMTLRVHSRPSRYPMARNFQMALKEQAIAGGDNLSGSDSGGILFERAMETDASVTESPKTDAKTLAFAVLHKPVGLPSHSTVDNAIENLLYQYQRYRELEYASLPQRLDTETSGLLMVATLPKFASYFSKLLEQKSTTASTTLAPTAIQKRYRCLVSFPIDSSEKIQNCIMNYIQSRSIVEHYVDAKSKAPKTFVHVDKFNNAVGGGSSSSNNSQEASTPHKWQLCKLCILDMTGPIQPRKSLVLSGSDYFELEIELLTGRTHQIRGQLADLGCPIVGDPLYGNSLSKEPIPNDWRDRSGLQMALQCCGLSFSVDAKMFCKTTSTSGRQKRKTPSKKQPEATTESEESTTSGECPEQFSFRLDSAWWRKSD